MKKRIIQSFAIACVTIAMVSFTSPNRWVSTGNESQKYEMGENVPSNHEGVGVATIKSTAKQISGFGALMQQLDAKTFLGKRVKVTGIVKSSDVAEWGGLWISVNQPLQSNTISLENMKHTSITGTKDTYTYFQIVTDVPANSTGIAYGSILKGTGQIWAGRVLFDIVEKSVPLTK